MGIFADNYPDPDRVRISDAHLYSGSLLFNGASEQEKAAVKQLLRPFLLKYIFISDKPEPWVRYELKSNPDGTPAEIWLRPAFDISFTLMDTSQRPGLTQIVEVTDGIPDNVFAAVNRNGPLELKYFLQPVNKKRR